MNKTTEQLLSQLNTMQSEHIKVLSERIEVLSKHKKLLERYNNKPSKTNRRTN